jgi:hypothetical protein
MLLKDRIRRQLLIYLPGYLLLAGGALFVLLDPPGSYKTVVNGSINLNDDETARMSKLAPYFSAFVLLMSTIFFGRIFYQSILPLIKDIKQKTKTLLYFKPGKSAMAFFNKYYISTPLYQKQLVEVSREDFDSIKEEDELHIGVGSSSMFILGLYKGDKMVTYY